MVRILKTDTYDNIETTSTDVTVNNEKNLKSKFPLDTDSIFFDSIINNDHFQPVNM